MPIGTARMASLCLPDAELHVGVSWDDHPALARALADPARPPILLYPGAGARDILAEPPAGPVTLVVVDGTWSQAKGIVRDSVVLGALPRYAFRAPEPTHYRIRREPHDAYVSTIEALMHVLGALEGDPVRFRALLRPLYAMVDAQLAAHAEAGSGRRRRLRARRDLRQEVADALAHRRADLVCLAVEANAWPFTAGAARAPDELVHLVAYRVADGTKLELVVAPAAALAPNTCRHLGLDEATLRAGLPLQAAFGQLAAFLRPADQLVTWGAYARALLTGAGATVPPGGVDLRGVTQRLLRRKLGGLEAYAAGLGPTPTAPLGAGRGGKRLGLIVQVLEDLLGAATSARAREGGAAP
jgi:DTW domain-containing protein YfiP